jgi:hypothetical protein
VNVIVERWQTLSGKSAKLEGVGRSFEEIAAERRRGPNELRDAAGSLRTSKLRSAPDTPMWKGWAALWPTGPGNCV